MSRADVAEAAAELTRCFLAAKILITQPDTIAANGPGLPAGPAEPWNGQAAAAFLGAVQEARDLEHELRAEVTGRPGEVYRTRGPARGGSDANTVAAIAAIVALAEAVDDPAAADAARRMGRRATVVLQLPAVDEAELWVRVRAGCHHCGCPMMQLAPRSGRVTCIRWGRCTDHAGNHPVGVVQQSVTGEPMVAWADGCIQYGEMEAP
jgi:hypothetical protein